MLELFVKFLRAKGIYESYTSQTIMPFEKTFHTLGWKRSMYLISDGLDLANTKEGPAFWISKSNEWVEELNDFCCDFWESIGKAYIKEEDEI